MLCEGFLSFRRARHNNAPNGINLQILWGKLPLSKATEPYRPLTSSFTDSLNTV